MTVQIVEIAGHKMAVLPVADYERLVDAAEDRLDTEAAVAAAERRIAGEAYLPAEAVDRILAGESALRVWREYRRLTGVALAAKAGVGPATISKLEAGLRGGRPAVWKALAESLDVTPADIMPVA